MGERLGSFPDISLGCPSYEDIPAIVSLVASEPEVLIPVTKEEVESLINENLCLVAKDPTGRVVGHLALGLWPESQSVELRSAVVLSEFRRQGINTEMERLMIARAREKFPGWEIYGFTEAGSMTRGILTKLGFEEISMSEVPEEFFKICPDSCFRKTGKDCGCKVYKLPEGK